MKFIGPSWTHAWTHRQGDSIDPALVGSQAVTHMSREATEVGKKDSTVKSQLVNISQKLLDRRSSKLCIVIRAAFYHCRSHEGSFPYVRL